MTAAAAHRGPTHGARAPGFTLVEAVISMVIVAVMLSAALRLVAVARMAERLNGDRAVGLLLAQGLLAEIMEREYADPDETPTFGPEGSETSSGRAAFDDVDDYHGLVDSPPADKSGAPLPDLVGWSREVRVRLVDPENPSSGAVSDNGAKHITVTVKRGQVVVARVVGLRATAADMAKKDKKSGGGLLSILGL